MCILQYNLNELLFDHFEDLGDLLLWDASDKLVDSMIQHELLNAWILMSECNLIDAQVCKLICWVGVLDNGGHSLVHCGNHGWLSFTILARHQIDESFDLNRLERVVSAKKVSKELNRFDSLQEDQHVLIFEHMYRSVEYHCVILHFHD